ncbi:NAD+ kinase [Bacillus sp. SORGH_AS 510]|uniref:NAD kinase n=1 Tax=Bacillus sp. SORGH_AS_0510 TaxID=3041771 RepID=UPI0027863658|nr:NAD kinase [Bacillus sp. SORGH_AS_0510]MDQ1144744.1 NAD+ kinase [Bacillus sp. SORGH_AS_0510]
MESRRNIYFYHKRDEDMLAKAAPLFEIADRYGFTMVNDYRKANIIASVGDDGTFLQAVRKTGFRDDCLYVGISTKNSLSMYCDFRISDTSKMIEAITTNEHIEVRRYPTIEVTVDGQGTFHCLNEFSIRSSIIKTLVLDVFVDQLHFETFRGDGLIVATPTGSTAYNKSVNGSVVDPLLSCMQVSEVASVNTNRYRTLGASFILGSERTLTLKVISEGNDHPTMGMDNEALSIRHVDKIQVKISDKKLKTLKLKDNSFWEKVKRTYL